MVLGLAPSALSLIVPGPSLLPVPHVVRRPGGVISS